MAKELSNSPEAIRQRRFREKLRIVPPEVTPVTPEPGAAVLHETSPVTGDKAAWMSTPELVSVEGGESKPIASEVAAAVVPRVTSPAEAAMMAKAIALYVGAGWGVLVADNRETLEPLVSGLMQDLPGMEGMTPDQRLSFAVGALVGVVQDSAAALCIKYNVRVPYQDEAVVAVAVGTATFGLFGKKKKKPPTDEQRVQQARNANVPREPEPHERPPARADGRNADGGFEL